MGPVFETYGVVVFLAIGVIFALRSMVPNLWQGISTGEMEGRKGVMHAREGDALNYWVLIFMNTAVLVLLVVAFIVSLFIAFNP